MNITITITNPTVNVLAALAGAHAADNAKMMESLDKASTALDVLLDEIARAKAQPEQAPNDAPVQDAPIITPQPDPQDTALRIASVADIDNYLDVGTEVHWHGAKYAFDGVVERISDDVFDTEGDLQYDVKAVFIRRNDTDKLVSLTLRDLQTGRLTLPHYEEKIMRTTSKNYPDWVEDLPDDNKAQPWGVYDQGPFVSIRQRDGGDPDTIHWVLIHKDEIEGFIEQVRNAAK